MTPIHRIVCPIDFSPASANALRVALDYARAFKAEIHAVHAYQLSAYASPNSDLARDLEEQIRKEVETFLATIETHGVPVKMALRLGVPYVEIVEAARELNAELVVMGTTGKTGLQHLLLGSVAERVVRTADVPVLSVRYVEPKA
jgi:nucleotide-binding universal stress UspA family protein